LLTNQNEDSKSDTVINYQNTNFTRPLAFGRLVYEWMPVMDVVARVAQRSMGHKSKTVQKRKRPERCSGLL
jgi:hypothetical protein